MDFYLGTSGYDYKEWTDSFYPEDLPASRRFSYYSERFRAVEINGTFRRMPTESMLAGWSEKAPDGFRYAMKAPQLITHRKRLKEVEEPVAELFRVSRSLGEHLGPILFQLPPNLKIDLVRLEGFLSLVADGPRVTIEFRHDSWFEDEVFEALRRHGVALCVAHGEKVDAPRVATADWGYLRLRRGTYSDGELREWAGWIGAQPWSEAWVFFMHEETASGPELGARMREVLKETVVGR